MSIIRNGIPKEFSLTSNDSFRLNESTASPIKSVDDGEEFAHTISCISKGDYEPEKATYPKFRKSFWEESRYNPRIERDGENSYAYNSYEIEQSNHWKKKGHKMSQQKRFPKPIPRGESGPVKASEYPHFFEKGQSYYGRSRKMNPFSVAKAYTKPLDRVNQATLKFIEEDKAKAGPGTYKPPDYWEKIVYGSVAEPLRPSAMMKITEQRDIYKYFNIPDYTELKKKAKNNEIKSPYHSQRGRMTTLLPGQDPQKNSSSTVNVNLNSSPRKKLQQAVSRSRLRGAKFPDSKLDYNYRGVPHDTRFVRLTKEDGTVMIAPVLISGDKPSDDEAGLKGTKRLPLWGDVSEKRDIYCVPANSTTEMFSDDNTSPAAQQDVYTLPGENAELTTEKLLLPGNKKDKNAITISAKRPPPNTTRPKTTPVLCTPFLSNRSLMQSDLKKKKKYSSENTPEVLPPNKIPLNMSDKFSLKRSVGPLSSTREQISIDDTDFNHIVDQSCDIADLFDSIQSHD